MKIKYEERVPISNIVKATIFIGLAQLFIFFVTVASILGAIVLIAKFIGG